MSDDKSGVVEGAESTDVRLSKKDRKRLAEMTAQLVAAADSDKAKAQAEAEAKKVDTTTRPEFDTEASVSAGNQLPKKQKGLMPGGFRKSEAEDFAVKAFAINKFPRDFDAKDFSVARYCAAVERSLNTPEGSLAFQKWAPKETAYYEALNSYGKESKALNEMTAGSDGGFLAPEIWTNTFFEMLFPAQVLSRLPITRMQMAGRVQHIPKLTSQVAVGYAAENASLTASNPAFSQLSFTARKQYAFIQIPNELIRDSAPAADQVIFNHAQTRMAVDRDTQILTGNGLAGAPTGLINATNVGTYTLAGDSGNGATPTYSDILSLINNVRQLNNSTNVPVGQTDCTGVVGAVRVEQTVAALKDGNSRPLWAYGLNQIGRVPAPGFLGVPNWVLTNIVPTNLTKGSATTASYLIAGDWQYLIYMMRQDVEFLATNIGGTSFQNDQTWVRLISRYDVGVVHPEAFCYAAGVLV